MKFICISVAMLLGHLAFSQQAGGQTNGTTQHTKLVRLTATGQNNSTTEPPRTVTGGSQQKLASTNNVTATESKVPGKRRVTPAGKKQKTARLSDKP